MCVLHPIRGEVTPFIFCKRLPSAVLSLRNISLVNTTPCRELCTMKRLILMMIKETTKWGSKYIFSGESHKTGPLCEILVSAPEAPSLRHCLNFWKNFRVGGSRLCRFGRLSKTTFDRSSFTCAIPGNPARGQIMIPKQAVSTCLQVTNCFAACCRHCRRRSCDRHSQRRRRVRVRGLHCHRSLEWSRRRRHGCGQQHRHR